MDQIAIISDVHGNLEALKTVLSDIKKRHIKEIFCLGDIIAKGVHSKECIKLIKENCKIVIRGNTDEFFANDFSNEDLNSLTKKGLERVKWNKNLLTNEDMNYLKELPYSYEFYFSGRLIRLFHASPESIDGFIGHFDKIENYYKLFLPSNNTISNKKADIVIYGHSHMQEMQKLYNRVIINTGSVGNSLDVFRNDKKDADPKYTTLCNYLILKGNYGMNFSDISYEFVNIPYDIKKELSSNIFNPEKEAYEIELLKGKYRDMKNVYSSFDKRGIDSNKI
ncbi:MAG: metallophosphoesterase family protein [Bacilli bacterium]|nr:metallophosphoesterase family protein [Bacilli bacterium]